MYKRYRLRLSDIEVFLTFTDPFEAKLVGLLVALSARSPDGRSALGVKHPELETGHVSRFAHFPAEGVNFPGEVSFGETADGGVAGHLTDRVGINSEQEGLTTQPGGGQGGLDAGVTGTDHDDIVGLWVNEHEGTLAEGGTGAKEFAGAWGGIG